MGSVARRYVQLVARRPGVGWAVLGVWVALAVAGGMGLPRFLRETTSDLGTSVASPGMRAKTALRTHGFSYTAKWRLWILLEPRISSSSSSSSPDEPSLLNTTEARAVLQHLQAVAGRRFPGKLRWDTMFDAEAKGEKLYAKTFLAPNGRSMFAMLHMNTTASSEMGDLAKFVKGQCSLLTSQSRFVSISAIGDALNRQVIIGSVAHDLAFGDGIALPISMAILAISLRSARLLLAPLVCIVLSSLTVFGAMALVAAVIPVISATISLITSVLIAFTLDFSLFLLSRYVETGTHDHGARDNVDLVAEVLETAGHTCLVSGSTLAAAFLVLTMVPQTTIRALGVGSLVAIVVVVLCQLTVVPVLLVLGQSFFRRALSIRSCFSCCPGRLTKWWVAERLTTEHSLKKSRWYRLGNRLVSLPYNVIAILVILALVGILVYPAVTFKLSDSFQLGLPRGNPYTESIARVTRDFSPGFLSGYSALIVWEKATDPMSADAWAVTDALAAVLGHNIPETNCSNIASVTQVACRKLSPLMYSACRIAPTAPGCPDLSRLRSLLLAENATLVRIVNLPFDPESADGMLWYDALLKQAKQFEASHQGVRVFIGGGIGWDGVQVAFSYFPYMVGLTFLSFMVLIGISFRSVIIPLRTLITVGATLLFAYGTAKLIYVNGVLDWLPFSGVHRQGAGLLWMPPVVSFTISAGLCLDYDILLLNRVREGYMQGFSTKEAIVRGLHVSGPVITTAGCIMSIAFGSLMFSASPALNLLGYYIVSTVLFDTFIVRIFLVPALFSLGSEWNWWPGSSKTQRAIRPYAGEEMAARNQGEEDTMSLLAIGEDEQEAQQL